MLREWKAELREASPANSLLQSANPSSSELSSDMERLLQFSLKDEDDDATSKAAPMTSELEQQSYNRHPPSPAPYQEAVGLEAFARIEQILQENPQSNLEAGASAGRYDEVLQAPLEPQKNLLLIQCLITVPDQSYLLQQLFYTRSALYGIVLGLL